MNTGLTSCGQDLLALSLRKNIFPLTTSGKEQGQTLNKQ